MNSTRGAIAMIIATAFTMTACAKSANEISAQYVSPLQYHSYNCKQLEMEAQMLTRRVSELGGHVDKTASNDNAQMAVGLIIFWPTLFFLDGDTPQAAEYARLKGEFEALEKAAIRKECGITIEHPRQPENNEKKKDKPAFPEKR